MSQMVDPSHDVQHITDKPLSSYTV